MSYGVFTQVKISQDELRYCISPPKSFHTGKTYILTKTSHVNVSCLHTGKTSISHTCKTSHRVLVIFHAPSSLSRLTHAQVSVIVRGWYTMVWGCWMYGGDIACPWNGHSLRGIPLIQVLLNQHLVIFLMSHLSLGANRLAWYISPSNCLLGYKASLFHKSSQVEITAKTADIDCWEVENLLNVIKQSGYLSSRDFCGYSVFIYLFIYLFNVFLLLICLYYLSSIYLININSYIYIPLRTPYPFIHSFIHLLVHIY